MIRRINYPIVYCTKPIYEINAEKNSNKISHYTINDNVLSKIKLK